jgi:hypothetical protein
MIRDELPRAAQRKLDAFKRSGSHLCSLVENSSRYKGIELFRRLNLALVDLLSTGLRLPALDPWADEPEEDEEDDGNSANNTPVPASIWKVDAEDLRLEAHMADYKRARELLEPSFAGHDFHRLVFDPYSPNPTQREDMTASLSDHLADIYAGIQSERRADEVDSNLREPPYERAWQWKFTFEAHWCAYHILPAITALTFLLHHYWDEDHGWSEVWQPELRSSELPAPDSKD